MLTSELSGIIDQLDLAFDKDPWYGHSIHSVLESVSPEQVFDSPIANVHSIAGLVSHLITWREFAIRRLRSENNFLPDQEESFNWQRRYTDKATAWRLLIEKLKSDQQDLLILLQQAEENMLDKQVAGKPYSFRYLLHGIIQHDLYHLGQISLICKIKKQNPRNSDTSYIKVPAFSYENLALTK